MCLDFYNYCTYVHYILTLRLYTLFHTLSRRQALLSDFGFAASGTYIVLPMWSIFYRFLSFQFGDILKPGIVQSSSSFQSILQRRTAIASSSTSNPVAVPEPLWLVTHFCCPQQKTLHFCCTKSLIPPGLIRSILNHTILPTLNLHLSLSQIV